MNTCGFEITDHTADAGIKIWAKDITDLFVEAAKGMVSLIVDRSKIKVKYSVKIKISSQTREELLLCWLKEILYVMEVNDTVLSEFQIENNNISLENNFNYFIHATLKGERLNQQRHNICNEIKAVTRHNFFLTKEEDKWKSFVLFDL